MIFLCRGVSVAMDTASTAEDCKYILADCKAEMIVVGYNGQFRKILEVNNKILIIIAINLNVGRINILAHVYIKKEYPVMGKSIPCLLIKAHMCERL